MTLTRTLQWLSALCLIAFHVAVTAKPQTVTPDLKPIVLGAARFDAYLPILQHKRVGLIVNQTSQVGKMHLVDVLLDKGVNVTTIFAPEHGFRGNEGAGEKIVDSRDPSTQLPIVSLYGKNKKPTATMLAELDVLVFDIQDVGARFYTYISTMHYAMQAAAEQSLQFVVLDRPNPNGRYVDGPVLRPEFQSFVGLHPIPVLHGLTVAELAAMIKGEGWITQSDVLDLHLVPMVNYDKSQAYSLPVPPSPNLPNDTAIALYPSLCFFEATELSIGRGTALPFQIVGHPSLDGGQLTVTPRALPQSAPYPKFQDIPIKGLDLTNSDIRGLDLSPLLQQYRYFKAKGVDIFDRPNFMDKLSGTDALRLAIQQGQNESQIRASWQAELASYQQRRQPYLLYPLQEH